MESRRAELEVNFEVSFEAITVDSIVGQWFGPKVNFDVTRKFMVNFDLIFS